MFLHGFGTSAFLWRNIAPSLANEGFTVLSLDLLGHGESDRSDDGLYGLGMQVEYVDRALTALRVPGAAFVGQDIGCIIALMLAGRRPGRRGKLVLLSPPDPSVMPPPSVRAVQRSSARAAITANELFGAFPLVRMLLSESVHDARHMSEQLIARYAAPFVGSDGVSHLLTLARAVEFENGDQIDLAAVSSDVLLVTGESDQWNEPGAMHRVVRGLKSAAVTTVSLPNVGHLIAEDAPGPLARLLLDWFTGTATNPESEPGYRRMRIAEQH